MSETRRIDCWVVSVLFVLLMTASLPIHADLADGLVAYYPFDGNANDQSGNNNHGIENGGPQYVPGIDGNAVQLDGIDDFIRVPASPSLNPVDQLSISFWMKVEGFTNRWSPIIHKGGPFTTNYTNREYTTWLYDTSLLVLSSTGDGASQHYSQFCCAQLHYWIHIVAIVDRQTHHMKTYVDGVLKTDIADSYSTFNNNNYDLLLGATEEINQDYSLYKGQLDELRIYNRALTDSEVQTLYTTHAINPPVTILQESTFETGLEGWSADPRELSWVASGGNPGGFALWQDASGSVTPEFTAPSHYLGNWSALDGAGFIRFDQAIATGNYQYLPGFRRVIISGPGGSATWYGPRAPYDCSDPACGWNTFKVPLTENAWTIDSGAWSEILANVTYFAISNEHYFAAGGGTVEATAYDNIQLATTTIPPTSLSLAQNQWHLISPLPLDGGGGGTVGEIVGNDILAGNLDSAIYGNAAANGWIMYQHNALTNLYENLTIDSPLIVGRGYWLKTLAANQSFTVSGNANSVTPIDLEAAPNPADGRSNMLGHPYDYNVCWNDAQISNDNFATFETPTTADPGNICDTDPADPTCILSRKMYKWNGAAYQTFDGTTPGAEGVLEPFDGFFVKVFKPGYQLQIPATPSCQGVTAAAQATLARALKTTDGSDPESASAAKKVRNPDEWNIRLTVSAEGLTDPGNLIGRLNDSRDGHDAHDLDERPADFNPHLTLVFPHHDWGNHAGDYTTDYRTLERNPTEVTDWDFEIRSDQLRTITLTWVIDSKDIRNHSRLIDVENKVTIKPKQVNRYTIPMMYTTHRFTWRMQAGR